MRHTLAASIAAIIAGLLIHAPAALAHDLPPAGPQCDGSQGEWAATVMLFTEGASLPAGAGDGVCSAAAAEQIAVDLATSSDAFHAPDLDAYDAVVFLANSGDVLSDAEQEALEGYIGAGHGFAGIHAAAGAEPGWAYYGDLVGARLQGVGAAEELRLEITDRVHPATAGLASPQARTDAWPAFTGGPRGNAHVLAQLDELPPYSPQQPARDDHPIAWCKATGDGRSFYTGMGGTAAAYADAAFRAHLGGGIAYAAGTVEGDCGATLSSSFEKVQLDRGLQMGEVMELAVLPDERVLYTNRGSGGSTGSAQVRIYSPASQSTSVAATIPVDQRHEDGLLGITLDPNFETNGWIYLYYSAQGEPLRQRLSRFTLVGDQLDMGSERVILEFPTERDLCCHSAGSMDWDSEGNLYLAVGDNTNSWESDGMVPIDERPERHPQLDAQRSAANTNDLRGKILRIKPLQDPGAEPGPGSTYTVPLDNLFPEFEDLGDKTRPEIYIMGVRNPFRISVDERSDTLYWGEVGPDSGGPIAGRGPAAHDEYNRATEAGNYGWPYCAGPNIPYTDYDFATGESSDPFPCGAATGPVNDSPRNTGLQQLPPTRPSTLWYAKTGSPEWPEFGSFCCSAAFGGEVYDPDRFPDSDVKFPDYYEDHWFIYEWQREWIKEVTFDDEGPSTGAPLEPSPWLPDVRWWRPMDMQFGPRGNLYVLEYADGYFSGSPNAALYRVDYVAGKRSPVARVDIDRDSGPTPLTVQFSGDRSSDPDGDPITYEWDFTNDGTVDATGPAVSHTYSAPGTYTAKLTVRDDTDRTGFENVVITAGNTRPQVSSTLPVDNGIFDWGDEIAFAFSATDAEDGEVPCADMQVTSAIVHAGHTHQDPTQDTCEGTLTTGRHDEDPGARFGYVIDGSYTDAGGAETAPPLTGRKTISLYPHRWQAEHFEASNGADVIDAAGAAGTKRMGSIEHGVTIEYGERDLEQIDSVTYRVSSAGAGGTIELRAGSPEGPVIATAEVAPTGSFDTYELVTAPVTDPGGSHRLFLVFTNPSASDGEALLDVDWFEFNGTGVAVNGKPYGATASVSPASGPVPLAVSFTADATDPDGDPLTFTWDFGDGQTGEGRTVNHTYTQPGNHIAEVTVSDGDRETTATVDVAAFSPGVCLRTEAGYCVLDLAGHHTNDGISEQGDFDDGNFDDAGWSYAGDTMPPEGPFTAGGVPFQFPGYGPGEKNSVEANGQTLPLAAGAYDQVKLLAAAHHGNPSAPATVNYTDGSTQQVTLALTDWAGAPAFGESVAVQADHRHSATGDTTPAVAIFVQTLTIDGERDAESITLPDDDRIHIFSVALREAVPVVCTVTGTDGADTLTGTEGDDVICAGGGDDVVDGLGGDDILRGGDGDDRLNGGAGSDECAGGAGTDTAAGCEAQSSTSTLALDPADSSTYTDETHEVTAAFGGDDPAPPAGTEVRFELHRGGEAVASEVVATDADGTAAFSYRHDQPAQDTIVACAGAASCDDAPWRATATNAIVAPPALEPDYELLFDGTSLDGWRQAGPGEFRVEDGSMVSYGGLGLLWYAAQEYENFSLRLSWKLTGETNNSGVFVRFPDPGDDPGVAISQGYEVQIYDADTGEPQKTGSIYNVKREERRNSNPIGHWNEYEIVAEGHRYAVILNGEVVNTFTGARNLRGFFGLQNHDPGSHVHFRHVRIKELPDSEPPTQLFDTIGITDDAHKQNGQLYGTPSPFSLPAEEMPAAGEVATPAGDDHDDVPVRMPDTSGAVPNLASMKGQTYTLPAVDRKAYDTLHVFGLSTDTGQGRGSGAFTLTYADGSTEQVTVALQDWGYPGAETAAHHIGIGPIPYRYTHTGRDSPVPFHVYHAAIPILSGQDLVSVTLANGTTPPAGGSYPFAQLYVMGLTLETAGGAFTAADLSAAEPEPEDTTAPTTTARAEPQPDGSARVTLSATDEEGGSGVARTEYRLDGGDWTEYAEPFTVTAPGEHTLEYRSVDEAGNEEEIKSLSFTVVEPEPDTTPPVTTATLDPPAPDGPGGKTYRGPVTVTLTASDGDGGSGVARTEYALDEGAWTEYGDPVRVSRNGEHVMRFRSVDEEGNLEAARQVRFVIAGGPQGRGEPYFVYGPNLALDGAVTVSSELGGYPASALNDGVRQTRFGYWNDATNGQFPDWAQIAWAQPQTVSYVVVRMPVADHLTDGQRTTGALRLQYWDGEWLDVQAAGNPATDWVAPTTADGSEARAYSFDAVTTDRIRVVVEEGNVDGWSYLEEIEAYQRRAASTPYSLRAVSGSTDAGTVLQPGDRRRLVAEVTDADGAPIPDYPVTFATRGSVLVEVTTDSAGRAATLVETGPRAGGNTYVATGPGAKPPAARFRVRTLRRGAALRVGREWLEAAAAELQEGSRITASDGTVMYTPDGVGSYAGFWVRDFQYMLEGFAEGIPAEHVRDGFRYLIARQREDGVMPDRVYADGTPFYCPGPGCDSAFGPLPATDNPQFMVKIAYGYWKSTGDLSLFERYADQLVRGMESLPRSPSTSLVHIPPEDPSSPYGFTDTIAKTGDLLFSSLLYYEAATHLAELSAAAGDEAGAARWTEEARTVERDLQTLYDEESGMLLAASVDCRQIDIWGSAYAAHIGAIPEPQQRRVAEYLRANYDGLVRRGQVRHTAPGEYWEKTIVPYDKDTYQNGAYWATPSGWVASVIGAVDRGLAQQMLVDLVKDFQANGINEAVNPDVGYVAIPKYVASATNPLPAFAALARRGDRASS